MHLSTIQPSGRSKKNVANASLVKPGKSVSCATVNSKAPFDKTKCFKPVMSIRDFSLLVSEHAIEIILTKRQRPHVMVGFEDDIEMNPMKQAKASGPNISIEPSMHCNDTLRETTVRPAKSSTKLKDAFAFSRNLFSVSRKEKSTKSSMASSISYASEDKTSVVSDEQRDQCSTPIHEAAARQPCVDRSDLLRLSEDNATFKSTSERLCQGKTESPRGDDLSAQDIHTKSSDALAKERNESGVERDDEESIDSLNSEIRQLLSLEIVDNVEQQMHENHVKQPEDVLKESSRIVCHHCKDYVNETGDSIQELPSTYFDKSIIMTYHKDCYQARKEVQMVKHEVDHEFMSICSVLRTAKSKSSKQVLNDNAFPERNSRPGRYQSLIIPPQPERVESLDEIVHQCMARNGSERSTRKRSTDIKTTRRCSSAKKHAACLHNITNESESSEEYDNRYSDEDDSSFTGCLEDESFSVDERCERRYDDSCSRRYSDSRRRSRNKSRDGRDRRRTRSRSISEDHYHRRYRERSQSASRNCRQRRHEDRSRSVSRGRHYESLETERRGRYYESLETKSRGRRTSGAKRKYSQSRLKNMEERQNNAESREEVSHVRFDSNSIKLGNVRESPILLYSRADAETTEQRSIRGDRMEYLNDARSAEKVHLSGSGQRRSSPNDSRDHQVVGGLRQSAIRNLSAKTTTDSARISCTSVPSTKVSSAHKATPSSTSSVNARHKNAKDTCASLVDVTVKRQGVRSGYSSTATNRSVSSAQCSTPSVKGTGDSVRSTRNSAPSVCATSDSVRSARTSTPSVRSSRRSVQPTKATSNSERGTRASVLDIKETSHSDRVTRTSVLLGKETSRSEKPAPATKQTSHSERGTRTSVLLGKETSHSDRGTRTTVQHNRESSHSQRATRTASVLCDKETSSHNHRATKNSSTIANMITSGPTSDRTANASTQSNVKDSPSESRSSRTSSKASTKKRRLSMKPEPKHQEAMSKMFGIRKPGTKAKKKTVVRKRRTARATAE